MAAMQKPWIKIRNDLSDDYRIIQTAHLLGASIATTIGAYVMLWLLADKHTTDGRIGVAPEALDRLLGVSGFAQAASQVGWLELQKSSVTITHFEEHNGESHKSRLLKSERQFRWKNKDAVVDHGPSPKRLSEGEGEGDKTPLKPPQGGASLNGRSRKRQRPLTPDEAVAASKGELT